jgi:hypothetical protein
MKLKTLAIACVAEEELNEICTDTIMVDELSDAFFLSIERLTVSNLVRVFQS